MEIKIGQTYLNRTLLYLMPSLKLLGNEFKAKFNSVSILAFGVHDQLLDGTHFEGQRLIYILIDKLAKPQMFTIFLAWIKLQPYYALDYAYDNLQVGRMHMVAITFPEKYADAYDKFILGKYSKMYTKDEVSKFFDTGKEVAKGIVTKSRESAEKHVIDLNNTYNSTITVLDLLHEGGEHDFPPQKHEEVFNCQKP